VLAACRARGIVTLGTATTVAEAQALAAAGVDSVCAQGAEAGAHRGTFLGPADAAPIGTIALVPLVVDAVELPVVAAGGIGDGRGLAAVLALGAIAAQVGTAFLLSPEASISAPYRAALAAAGGADTAVTTAFSGRAARTLRNRFVDEMHGDDAIAPYPYQNTLTGDIRAAAAAQNEPELLSLYAGQAAALATPSPSAEIVRAFAIAAAAALARARSHLT
jgi:nitronate monooxygenase